jgi:hypothetical protein
MGQPVDLPDGLHGSLLPRPAGAPAIRSVMAFLSLLGYRSSAGCLAVSGGRP